MMMNRKLMQKIVASIVIFGVAASGAVTFISIAATQQPANTTVETPTVQPPVQQPVQPQTEQEGAVTPSPEPGVAPTVETPTESTPTE